MKIYIAWRDEDEGNRQSTNIFLGVFRSKKGAEKAIREDRRDLKFVQGTNWKYVKNIYSHEVTESELRD